MTADQLSTTGGLRALAQAAAPFFPLTALSPAGYAAKHALFESRSDQRERVTAWLTSYAAGLPRHAEVQRVLSIGCGDGSVDVEVARTLAAAGPVSYHGIEPHSPSAALFAERLGAVDGVEVTVETGLFGHTSATGNEGFDLVLAVHSLYYVPDLPAALATARLLLAPGGRLVVVHAPREELNSLVGVLAPGRTQEFSDAVAAAITDQGWGVTRERIDATLDLSKRADDDGEWRDILDFTVQAAIPDGLIDQVERALADVSRSPGNGLILSHPVDAFVIS